MLAINPHVVTITVQEFEIYATLINVWNIRDLSNDYL